MKSTLALALILLLIAPSGFFAKETKEESTGTSSAPSPSPFVGFWTNTIESHAGTNSLWHLGALGATGLMILTPADQVIMEADKNLFGDAFNAGALIVGTMWHVLPAALVYWTTDTPRTEYASGAVIQAVGVTFLVTTAEKLAFGRAFIDKGDDGPPDYLPFRRSDDARAFYPFRNLGGLWPSGHTATAFAAASALASFYRDDESFLPFAVLAYAASALMGYAMIDGDIHWASDVVAGALIGHAIGWTIGKDFRSRHRRSVASKNGNGANVASASDTARTTLVPLLSNGSYGVLVTVKY